MRIQYTFMCPCERAFYTYGVSLHAVVHADYLDAMPHHRVVDHKRYLLCMHDCGGGEPEPRIIAAL